MTIQLAARIVPSNNNTFFLLEDTFLKGSLQIRNNIEDRDSIPLNNLKLGALVLTIAENTIWQVDELILPTIDNLDVIPSVEWKVFSLGGGPNTPIIDSPSVRSVMIQNIPSLPVGGSVDFDVRMAVSCIALRISVSRPVRIKVFGTPERDEINPYEFLATPDHLVDDGRQLLADGTIFRTRNYSIFANFEDPVTDRLYFTVENLDDDESGVAVTVIYLPLEILLQETIS